MGSGALQESHQRLRPDGKASVRTSSLLAIVRHRQFELLPEGFRFRLRLVIVHVVPDDFRCSVGKIVISLA